MRCTWPNIRYLTDASQMVVRGWCLCGLGVGYRRFSLPILAFVRGPCAPGSSCLGSFTDLPSRAALPSLASVSGIPHGPLMALLGSSGLRPEASSPAWPPLPPPLCTQGSHGDVWIPEGMFSTFLETHCGLVFRGKGLGRGSAQWKADGWEQPESRRPLLSAHCVPGPRDSQML